jgi:hypothetical protein
VIAGANLAPALWSTEYRRFGEVPQMQRAQSGRVVPVSNLTEYFRDALHGALVHQHVAVDDQTEQYVVNMLTLFSRAEELHASMPNGRRVAPLATLLAAAVDAPTALERNQALQRLGDVSLFMAGFFAHGFARRLVDVDYHIAMGGCAYSTLASSMAQGRRRALSQVFAELASKFQPLVDALGEISDTARVWSQSDVLRLYEMWLKTGSTRAKRLLGDLGVAPVPATLRTQ